MTSGGSGLSSGRASRSSDDDPFKKGTTVEVSGYEEGLMGSWHAATVLRPNPGSSKRRSNSKPTTVANTLAVDVQYHNLLSDDPPHLPLVESVDIVHLRPLPPRDTTATTFRVNDEVDAYINDAWWEAVITDIISMNDDQNRREQIYCLYFRTSKELLQIHQKDQIRLHREWVYGKWIPPPLPEEGDDRLSDFSEVIQ